MNPCSCLPSMKGRSSSYAHSGCILNMQKVPGCCQAQRSEAMLQDICFRQAHRRQPGSVQAIGRQGPGDADQAPTDGPAFTRRTLFMSAAGSALVPALEPTAQASEQITGLAAASTPGAGQGMPGQAAVAGKGMTAVRDPAVYRCLMRLRVGCHLPAAPPASTANLNDLKQAQARVPPAAGV